MPLKNATSGQEVIVHQTNEGGTAAGNPFSVVPYKSLEDQIEAIQDADGEWTALKTAVATDRTARDTQFQTFMGGLADDVHTHPNGCLVRLRTAGGQATDFWRFNWLDYARLRPDTDQFGTITDTHEAFCDGSETGVNQRAYEHVYVAAYPLSIKNGEVVSQSGSVAATGLSLDQAISLCNATDIVGFEGKHRLWSIWDRSLVLHHCMASGYQPIGNTLYGFYHGGSSYPGISGAETNKTLTGTMGSDSAHTGNDAGIYDLVGNVWEWCYGLEAVEGRLKIVPDNRSHDCNRADLEFKAQWLSHNDSNQRVEIVGFLVNQVKNGPDGSSVIPGSGGFNALSRSNSIQLRRAFIAPIDGTNPVGGVYAKTYGERALMVGGSYNKSANSGLAALWLSNDPSMGSSDVGFRSAFAV